MGERAFKDQVYMQFARIGKALASPARLELLDLLAQGDRLVATYLHARQGLEAVSRDQLRQRLATGTAVVLDVRPALEYRQGHIAGARSMPLDELQARLDEVDPAQEIVAYCRGPF